jgi:hypothetical protein
MLRAKGAGLLACLMLLTAGRTAFGQGGDSGSIVGYVFDQTGTPIAGVKVTASSPTQIGGLKISYTNSEGAFHMRALIPGTFEVKAEAPKLKTAIQTGVRVGITSPADVSLVMEVSSSQVEEVSIVQRAPLVSTTKPNLREDFDSDFVESLPHHGRDNIHRDMIGSVAGAMTNRMRGGAANQTVTTQDGFDMGPPGKTISPAVKSTAAFEIQTGGYGADNPTASGGILNLVTRSGSNKFEFEFNATGENDTLRFFRDQRDPRSATFYYVINPTFAGPIIKDKLWFFINTETHLTQDGRQRDVEGIFPDPVTKQRFIQKGSTKLTWQATSRNKLSAIVNYELIPREINRIDGLGVAPEAQEIRATQRIFLGTIWESLLRDDLIMRTQVGGTYIPEHIFPSLCEKQPVDCEHIPAVLQTFPRQQRLENDNNHTRTDVFAFQVINQLDFFADSTILGEHNLTLKNRFYAEQETRKQSRPGDKLIELTGNDPSALTTYYANDPRYEDPRYGWFIGTDTLYKDVLTLSDNFKPTRHLTITPSISNAWGKASDARGNQVINASSLAPGLSAVWDATHDGRTAVRGSVNTYLDLDIGAVARHMLGSQAQQRCRWNATTQAYDTGCVFSGGLSRNTIGLPCGPSGFTADGQRCDSPLEIPRTYELAVGAERELVQGVALALDFVHRKYTHQYEINETNRIWNDGGTQLDGRGGYRNGRAETILDLETPTGAQRRYEGVTLGVTKREGRLKARISYTWSELVGTVAGGSASGANTAWGDIPSRDRYLDGYLPDDHRHEVKGSLSFQATTWLSFGSRTTYTSGQPTERLFRNDETGTYDVYRATRGINPGANVNDPGDDRQLRLPDQFELNLQGRLNLLPLIGKRLDLYVDVLNALAIRTVTTVGTNDGQDFGVERAWMDPFRIRLGLNFRY